jgi:hypothetical protein
MKLNDTPFNKVKKYVLNKKMVSKDYSMVRVTLIKGNKILYEYDFLLRRLLNRKEAKSKVLYSKTIHILKDQIENSKKKIVKKKGWIIKIKSWLGLK